jgi:hypothetical protein
VATERGGSVLFPLLTQLLAEEQEKKQGLEQRGIAVITTSGVLASLLFGLGAVVTDDSQFSFPSASIVLLVAAVCFFVLAALAGLVTNAPLKYDRVEGLADLVHDDQWNRAADEISRGIATGQVRILETARTRNGQKAVALLGAIAAEAIAVICVAFAIALALLDAL